MRNGGICMLDFDDGLKWSGLIVVTVWDDGGLVGQQILHNLVMNVGKNLLVSALQNSAVNAKITYVSLGSGSTAVANTQTALVAEQFRKAMTSYTTPGTGQSKSTIYIAPGEATTFTTNEIGWFGNGATVALNSGTMIARVLYTRTKAATESLQIDRIDTLS